MAKDFDFSLAIDNAEALGKSVSDEIKQKLRTAMIGLAKATYSHGVSIITKSDRKLKSTAVDYLDNFNLLSPDENTRIIELNPKFSYLEDGYGSYDMKPGLLHGRQSVIIPFLKKTSASATNLAEQLMAIELKQALKQGEDRRGNRKDMNRKQPGEGNVGRASSSEEHHPYVRGAVRIQKQYNKQTQSSFIVFRRLSTKTDPSKWIHPGFAGVHAFPDMENFAQQKFDDILLKNKI